MKLKISILLLCNFLGGCASFKGGMPSLPYEISVDMGIAKDQISSYASVKKFYDDPSELSRNKYISAKLLIINYAYLDFIKGLTSEEAIIHSASEILILALDIGATGSTVHTTKTALSGVSSLIGGSRMSIDKNAYYQKAMSGLVSGMNANRKEVLIRLMDGVGRSLNAYPLEQAMSDINDYYQAGTLMSAISRIEKDSGIRGEVADKAISKILIKRDSGFVDAVMQAHVSATLTDVEKLTDSDVLNLVAFPPISQPSLSALIKARDPGDRRLTDPKVAKQILKMQIVYWDRNDTNLKLWASAIEALTVN